MEAAALLEADGLDVSVINCRFIKPLDMALLKTITQNHRLLVTVEDGAEVNGFGAYVSATVHGMTAGVRVTVMGVPDRTYEHAARARQLAWVGLTAEGIADRVRARHAEESFSTA